MWTGVDILGRKSTLFKITQYSVARMHISMLKTRLVKCKPVPHYLSARRRLGTINENLFLSISFDLFDKDN